MVIITQLGDGCKMNNSHTNSELIDLFTANQEARSFSAFTIRRRRSSLTSLSRFCLPLTFGEIDAPLIGEWIATHSAPRTRHAYRSDACAFFAWAMRRKLVDNNPAAETDTIRVPKALPRPVPVDAVRHIIASAPDAGMRLGLALATFAGLRRSEVVNLMTGDVSLLSRPPMLTVRNGKWGKDRQVPLHPELARLLDVRQTQGFLVPMTADCFGRRAAEHIRRCGYDMTVHQLRSTFATELARITAGNVLLVSRLLGHESMNTSALYIGLAGFAGVEQVATMYGDDAA